jgi:hypothetical protein
MMQGTIVMSGAYRCNVLKPKGGDYRAEMWKTALLMSRAVLLPPPWIEEEKHLEVQYMLTKPKVCPQFDVLAETAERDRI